MSKIKNTGLDQYGAEPFEQQQFGTAGVEMVNRRCKRHQLTLSGVTIVDGTRRAVFDFALFTSQNFSGYSPLFVAYLAL